MGRVSGRRHLVAEPLPFRPPLPAPPLRASGPIGVAVSHPRPPGLLGAPLLRFVTTPSYSILPSLRFSIPGFSLVAPGMARLRVPALTPGLLSSSSSSSSSFSIAVVRIALGFTIVLACRLAFIFSRVPARVFLPFLSLRPPIVRGALRISSRCGCPSRVRRRVVGRGSRLSDLRLRVAYPRGSLPFLGPFLFSPVFLASSIFLVSDACLSL